MRHQQAEGRRNFLQHVSGEVPAALPGQIVADFAEVVLALGREYVPGHLGRAMRRVEFRYQLDHDRLAIKALALLQRFEALGDLGVHIVPAEPTSLRQIPFDRLADQLAYRTVLLGGSSLYFGQQAGGDKAIGGVSGFHASSLSNSTVSSFASEAAYC